MQYSGDNLYSRVLVTGANGLVGQAVIRSLSAGVRYDVLATARSVGPVEANASYGRTTLDVTNHDDVARAFEDFSPSVVVNCAAMTEVDRCETDRARCWQVNVDAVENLARLCYSTGARLIQVSTDFVFNGKHGPYRETDRPAPVNFYGRSKLAAENACRGAGEGRWTVARTILVYGCEHGLSRSNFVLWVADELSNGREIRVVTDQYRTPTYNVDLAVGIERLVGRGASGIFHLGGKDLLSVFDFAIAIAEAFELDASLIRPTDSATFRQPARRPARTGLDIGKAIRELRYNPRSLREALAELRTRLRLRVP